MTLKQLADALIKLTEKVDNLTVEQAKGQADLSHIKSTLDEMKVDVAHHIKRTDLLEQEITKVRGFLFYFALTVTTIAAATTVVANLWKVLH